MRTPIVISLGDKSWQVRPLTLGQAADIEPLLNSNLSNVDRGVRILAIALRRDHPQVTEKELRDIEAPAMEMVGVTKQILEFSGFISGKPASGEAPAPESGAS